MSDLTPWAESFRHFAVAAAPVSPLYAALAEQIAGDEALLTLSAEVPRDAMPANVLLAAVQQRLFALAGDPLAAWYASLADTPLPAESAFPEFRRFALAEAAALRPVLRARRTNTNEIQRAAVLLPAFGLAAARQEPLHLVEVGCSAGLLLAFDRLAYDYGAAGGIGAPGAPIVLSCRGEGPIPLPARMPRIASRVGLDLKPLDAADPADASWLAALIWPEQRERRRRLDAALALTREARPRLVAGDAAETFAGVAADLPPDGLVVVFHSFAIVQFPRAARARLLAAIDDLARRRPVWRIGYEHRFATHAALELQRLGEESEMLRLAEAAPHGEWLRWTAP